MKLAKLGTGGDIHQWTTQMETHFRAKGFWNHVNTGAELVVGEDDDETPEMKAAQCRRDILLALHKDILTTVQHLPTANEMFARVKKLFLGSLANQKRILREKLAKLAFGGNYFYFLSNYESLVSQLGTLNGVLSYQDLTLQFLSKLPKTLSHLTHGLKQAAENAQQDNLVIWTNAHSAVLDYVMDCGWYDVGRRQVNSSGRALNATRSGKTKGNDRRKNVKCYKCGKKGHFKRDCPELKKKKKREKVGICRETAEG